MKLALWIAAIATLTLVAAAIVHPHLRLWAMLILLAEIISGIGWFFYVIFHWQFYR